MAKYDPVSTGLAVAGAGASYLTGRSAAKAQKEAMRRQAQLIGAQGETYRYAQQYFPGLIDSYARLAGLQMPVQSVGQFLAAPAQRNPQTVRSLPQGQGTPMQQLAGQPNPMAMWGSRRTMGGPPQMGSNWGTPEDQLRFQAAEEDINRGQQQRGSQLAFNLRRQGLSEAAIGAALARNASQAGQQAAGFRRQLAIDAPQEQARRLAQLQGILGLGFGEGQVAAAGLGQQGSVYGGQAAAAGQQMANIANQFMYQQQLRQGQRQRSQQPIMMPDGSWVYPDGRWE